MVNTLSGFFFFKFCRADYLQLFTSKSESNLRLKIIKLQILEFRLRMNFWGKYFKMWNFSRLLLKMISMKFNLYLQKFYNEGRSKELRLLRIILTFHSINFINKIFFTVFSRLDIIHLLFFHLLNTNLSDIPTYSKFINPVKET